MGQSLIIIEMQEESCYRDVSDIKGIQFQTKSHFSLPSGNTVFHGSESTFYLGLRIRKIISLK